MTMLVLFSQFRRISRVVVAFTAIVMVLGFASVSHTSSPSGKPAFNQVSVCSIITAHEFSKTLQLKHPVGDLIVATLSGWQVTQYFLISVSWYVRAAVDVRNPIYVFTSIHAP